jgi:hypothetical protein
MSAILLLVLKFAGDVLSQLLASILMKGVYSHLVSLAVVAVQRLLKAATSGREQTNTVVTPFDNGREPISLSLYSTPTLNTNPPLSLPVVTPIDFSNLGIQSNVQPVFEVKPYYPELNQYVQPVFEVKPYYPELNQYVQPVFEVKPHYPELNQYDFSNLNVLPSVPSVADINSYSSPLAGIPFDVLSELLRNQTGSSGKYDGAAGSR